MDCSEDMREPWEREEEEQETEFAFFAAMAAEEKEFFCLGDEPTAVIREHADVDDNEEPCAQNVKLPLAPELAVQPATLDRAVQQQDTPGSPSKKRARGGAEGSGAPKPSLGALSSTTSAGSSDVGLSGQLKRLRYRVKSTPPPEVAPPPEFKLPPCHKEEFVTKKVWTGMTGTAQYNYAYEKIRCFYIWQLHGDQLRTGQERDAWKSKSSQQKQKEGRQAFKDLATDVRNVYIRKWMELVRPPSWFAKCVEDRFLTTDVGSKICRVKTQGVLLTWNLPGEGPSDSGRLAQSLPPVQLTVDEVVTRLRNEPTARALWGRVIDHGQVCKQLAGADDVAVCLEVCPETYELQRKLRLHIHMFLKSSGGPLRLRHMTFYDFEGCSSHVSTQIGGLATTKGRSNWCGFFYCCLQEKRGTVFTEATKAPFSKFLVNPAWIMSLVQASKLPTRAARELLVRCVNASRHVKELEQHEEELEKEAVKLAMAEASSLLNNSLKKQKFYEKAEAFTRQFEEPRHRYKFLVLSGPSRVGKTAFARSLCEEGKEVLEVNCASGDEPNLRAYRLRRHGLILFDEIVAGQVAQQRKLFQAQSAPVQLGCSATNCHSYDVFVWRKRLVLASNNWHTSLAALGAPDQEWIHANSIVLDVAEAMWVS